MASPLPCYHCGLPVPPGSSWHARVLNETRAMCCPGCQAVAEAIVNGGLESYYQHRSESSINPAALPQALSDELALYDREDVQQPFVRHEGDLSSTSLMMVGISVAGGEGLSERHFRGLDGVAAARLNLSDTRLRVRWGGGRRPLSELLAGLRRIGHAAHASQADQVTERMASENRRS